MNVSIRMRARSSALLPASCIPKSLPSVRVGQGGSYDISSAKSSSASTNTTETTTTTTEPSDLAKKLPLYALYIVVAGVIYYVGYKVIKAVF